MWNPGKVGNKGHLMSHFHVIACKLVEIIIWNFVSMTHISRNNGFSLILLVFNQNRHQKYPKSQKKKWHLIFLDSQGPVEKDKTIKSILARKSHRSQKSNILSPTMWSGVGRGHNAGISPDGSE